MTELELCQLSQQALMIKLRKVEALSRSRLRRLRKAESAVKKLLLRCQEYEKALEEANQAEYEALELANMVMDDA